MIFYSNSAIETENFAKKLAQKAKTGNIYCLNGDLGAGKTAFAKGFAKGLGIEDDIVSPTFTLINEYFSGNLPLYHFDVYRIQDITEMQDTGYEEYFYGDGICLIEWSVLIKELIPASAISISIERDLSIGENYRKIKMEDINNENFIP